MTDQTQEFPVVTGDRMAFSARRNSIKALVKRANRIGTPIPEFVWDALNNRYLRKMLNWKARYNRQRQHALQLQNKLTEKNAYILELHAEIKLLDEGIQHMQKTGSSDFFAK